MQLLRGTRAFIVSETWSVIMGEDKNHPSDKPISHYVRYSDSHFDLVSLFPIFLIQSVAAIASNLGQDRVSVHKGQSIDGVP